MLRARKHQIERDLRDLFDEMNAKYFCSTVFVQNIRIGKFFRDLVTPYIHFGVFMMDTETETRPDGSTKTFASFAQIIISSHIFIPSVLSRYPRLPEFVLFHEMCHAMVELERPHTTKIVCSEKEGAHGPEWQKYWTIHPDHLVADQIIQNPNLHATIMREAIGDISVQGMVKKCRDGKIKLKW